MLLAVALVHYSSALALPAAVMHASPEPLPRRLPRLSLQLRRRPDGHRHGHVSPARAGEAELRVRVSHSPPKATTMST